MTAVDQPPIIIPDAAEAPEEKRRRRPRHIRGSRPGWFVYASLGVVLLAAFFPYYWSLLIGSGDAYTIRDPNMSWLPGGNFFANAASVVNDPAVNFWPALWNSIYSSALIAISVVFFSTLAGWAFAKLKFRGSSILLVFVIATMAVPTQLAVVPLYIVMANLQLAGTLWAVIVPALTSAFGVFWMTQYLEQTLPPELIEAARIDGANMLQVFWYVGLPAARPAAAMLALFTFIQTWTNFFWPFIVLDKDSRTLPVALQALANNFFDDYSLIMAGVVLSIIPLLILFVLAGKQLVAGIMSGAVKG